MARWLTDVETAALNEGQLPVLFTSSLNSPEPLDLCIGWAANEAEATHLLAAHPKVMVKFEVIPGTPPYRLSGVAKDVIRVGDENGVWLPDLRKPYPGTFFNIGAYVPTYSADEN